MLFWAAVVNGLLAAPPPVVLVTLLTSAKRVMDDKTSPKVLQILGWLAAIIMTGASLAMAILEVGVLSQAPLPARLLVHRESNSTP